MPLLNLLKKNKSFFVAILIFVAIGSAFLVTLNKAKAECTYLGEGGWDCPPGENPPTTTSSQKSTSPATSQPSSQTQSQGPTDTQLADACKGKTRGDICTPQGSKYQGVCQSSSNGGFSCYTGENTVVNEAGQTQKQAEEQTAGGFWDWIGNIAFSVIAKAIYYVTYAIFYIFGLLLSLAGAILDFVLTNAQLNKFTQSPIVQTGWDITKNLANMFFALILLIISFATILRIESYGIKQVLPRLIIAALLINFSLVIGGVVIDFTQVLTKYFVDAALQGTNGKSLSATIAQKLQVTQGILATKDESKTPPISESLDGSAAAIGGLFAGTIVILIAAFVFFAAALFFIVRYIALLFLLILAPLAWFFYIVPFTKKYWDMWWSTFFKWAFFAPAYAFFLYLSMVIIKSDVMSKVGISTQGASDVGFGRYTIPMLINYTIMIGFLLGSIIVAQKVGVMGAGAAMGMVKGAGKGFGRMTGRWAARGAPMPRVVAPVLRGLDRVTFRKLGLGKAATKYEAGKAAVAAGIKKVPYVGAAVGAAAAVRKTLPTLFVPAVWKRALASREARANAEAFTQAAGRLEGILSLSPKEAEERQNQARDAEVNRKMDDFRKTFSGDEDRMVQAYQGAKTPLEKEALVKLLASVNGLNTLMKAENKPLNPGSIRNYIKDTFGDKEGARVAAAVGGMGVANKNYSYFGMSYWDKKDQQYKFAADDKSQAEAAAKKSMSEEPQDWARGIRAESFVGKDAAGKMENTLTETGRNIISNLTLSHVNQVQRMRIESLQAIVGAKGDIEKLIPDLKSDQQEVVKKFIVEVENKYKGKTETLTSPPQSNLAGGSQEELKQARGQHPPGAFG